MTSFGKILASLALIISSVTTNSSLYAQYFNELLETNDTYEFSFGYNYDGSNLIGIHAFRDSSTLQQGWTGVQFKRYNSNYEVDLDTRFYDASFSYYPGWQISYDGDAYYIGGYKFENPSTDTSTACLFKYTSNGNLLWIKEYLIGSEGAELKYCHFKNDSLYASINYIDGVSGNVSIEVMSLDTSGNIGWTKTICSGNDSESLVSFHPTSDNGFILSTYKQYGFKATTIIHKLDSLGLEEWSTEIGYSLNKHVASTYEMPDGTFLAYGYSEDELQARKQSWIIRLSAEGALIQDSIFNFSSGYDTFKNNSTPLITNDGFQMLGVYYDDYTSNTAKAQIVRCSNTFDLIWRRVYYHRDVQNGFAFQKPLENGFTLFAGYSYLDDPNVNTHDDWILVLDSMGCDVPNCNLGLADPSDELQLKLYPIPAKNTLSIDFSDVQSLPLKAQIISSSGQLIDEYNLTSNLNTVDLRHLDNGLYLLLLSDETGLYRKEKFVVEH